ncbi:ubiquitin carboxyl-terminal hydrolase 37-like [Scomber scombrus]|uniref:Ubiquitin carboxyl-terminal hydrolase n=1 Tax=Scomber scombrus TaxID=13677 RepID=A0AAV1NMR4_SCOSC
MSNYDVFITSVSVTDASTVKSSAGTYLLRRLLCQPVKNRRVAPAPESNVDKPKEIQKQPRESHAAEDTVLVSFDVHEETKKEEEKKTENNSVKTQSLCQRVDWFGFRNPGNLCYVNSSLQSLITLKGFVDNFVMQVEDAHEFIIAVLDQLRNLAPLLQRKAALMGTIYRCPVENNFIFKMTSTRTCKGCGAQSSRDEEFSNLSLNLVSGASVQDMLQDYLMETDIDFRCDCGAKKSGQQSTFATLPKILMLQLKRFKYTRSLRLEKLHDAVVLFRELMVTSRGVDGWYSLVSVVSHLGMKGQQGHYVSDGVHPDAGLDDPADRWLHYSDAQVTEVKGDFVCDLHRGNAYVLFYERRDETHRMLTFSKYTSTCTGSASLLTWNTKQFLDEVCMKNVSEITEIRVQFSNFLLSSSSRHTELSTNKRTTAVNAKMSANYQHTQCTVWDAFRYILS